MSASRRMRSSWLTRGVETLWRVGRAASREIPRQSGDRRRGAPRPGEKSGLRERTSDRVELIGRNVSQPATRLHSRSIAPILAAVLAGGLLVVVLRTEVLHLRYAVADAVAEEQKLSEQKRSLTVAMRKLRDPARLARRARELGFGQPERLIELGADPTLGSARRRAERLSEAPGAPASVLASADSRP